MPAQIIVQTPDGRKAGSLAAQEHAGELLSDALAKAGVHLNTRCGKHGWCHGCIVELVTRDSEGRESLRAVKACETPVDATSELVVRVPAHARLENAPQVGDSFEVNVPVALEPLWRPAATGKNLALAVDVGTTTVAVALVDLVQGGVVAKAGDFNAQIRFGDNVITRIVASGAPGVLAEMQRAVLMETLFPLATEACREAGRTLEDVAGCIISGNTTMLHLLAGEDPSGLGVVPFTPRFIGSRKFKPGDLGLGGEIPVVLLPGFSAYVGADLVAGVYATGMLCDRRPSLLVDIGTNGEIVLQAGGRMYACATAAGPAFEGAGLLAGTRAQRGAISHIKIRRQGGDYHFDLETIAGTAPALAPGLCGTAYVDFLAEGRAAGLLLPSGRFDPAAWTCLPEDLRSITAGGKKLKLAGSLCVNEADIAALLQAKAAIGAGIETLLTAAGLRATDIATLYLAGGFGLYIDVGHAIAIGLLPGFAREQVKVVGNTSLAGAVLAAVDRNALDSMEQIREQALILELNQQPGFEDNYLDHLVLP